MQMICRIRVLSFLKLFTIDIHFKGKAKEKLIKMKTIFNGNIRILKMIVKMTYHILLSTLDIFEECRKYKQ